MALCSQHVAVRLSSSHCQPASAQLHLHPNKLQGWFPATPTKQDDHMQDLLCASYHLRASGLFQQLVEAGQKRVAPAENLNVDPAAPSLAALLDLLNALQVHQQSTDAAQALLVLAESVGQKAAAVFTVLPDVATDAVLTLWQGARSLLEGAIRAQDTGAEQAAKVIKVVQRRSSRVVLLLDAPESWPGMCCDHSAYKKH